MNLILQIMVGGILLLLIPWGLGVCSVLWSHRRTLWISQRDIILKPLFWVALILPPLAIGAAAGWALWPHRAPKEVGRVAIVNDGISYIGIGDTLPSSLLDQSPATATAWIMSEPRALIDFGGTTGGSITFLSSGGTEVLRIDGASGDVGIGTSPEAQ